MGQQVIETLAEFNETDGKTVILVTHDPKIAMYCRKVIFMKDGHLLDFLERRGRKGGVLPGNRGEDGRIVAQNEEIAGFILKFMHLNAKIYAYFLELG